MTGARWVYAAAGALFLCFGYQVARYRPVAVGGADSYGYAQLARILAEKGWSRPLLEDPYLPLLASAFSEPERRILRKMLCPQYHAVLDYERGTIFNQFPPGFPLVLSLPLRWGWEDGPLWVPPFLGCLFFLLAIPLFRRWLPGTGWLVALGGFFFLPLVRNYAVVIFPDLLSALLALLVLTGIVFSRRNGAMLGWGALTGAALLCRVTNVLFLIPAAWVAWRSWREPRSTGGGIRTWLWFGAGFLAAGPLALGWYQAQIFGSPWATTYSSVWEDFSGLFTWEHLRVNLPCYLRFLVADTGWRGCWWLALIAVGLAAAWRRNRPLAAITLILGAVLLAIFSLYDWRPVADDTPAFNPRYLLPVFPFLALLAGTGWEAVVERLPFPRVRVPLAILVAGLPAILFWNRIWQDQGMPHYEEISQAVSRQVEPDAVIFAGGVFPGNFWYHGRQRCYNLRRGTPAPLQERVILRCLELGWPCYLLVEDRRMETEVLPRLSRRFRVIPVDWLLPATSVPFGGDAVVRGYRISSALP